MLAAVVVLLRSLRLICSGHRAVALENVALRQQLSVFRRTVRRPQLRTRDRLFWVLLAKAWRHWRTALIVVQPDTVVRWHRQWLRRRWTKRSTPKRPGRPTTSEAIRTLVEQMAAVNPLWGAPRIHGELGKLGIEVSERSVSRLLRRRRRPPSQTWQTFLTNHVAALVSMDFFTVPTLTGRVLFVLVSLAHSGHVGESGSTASLVPLDDRDPQATSSRNSRDESRTAAQCGFGEGQPTSTHQDRDRIP
jgi:putative transposase